jgi:two-component system NtrC family sensor kinase
MTLPLNRRILLIGDQPGIHGHFRTILGGGAAHAGLDDAEARLSGRAAPARPVAFELDCASQGRDGVAMAGAALREGRPYAMAFIDMRMPPGWDGVDTVEHLWQVDPGVQVVVCTAYADHSWEAVLARLDAGDRLLVLKKPFDTIEVRQLANTLTEKWRLTRQAAWRMERLEETVLARTDELVHANARLAAEIVERKQLQSRLLQSEKLASIGLLAAGVAHEINNPLGFLAANFGVLEEYTRSLCEMLGAYEAAQRDGGAAAAPARLKDVHERLQLDYLRQDLPVLIAQSRDGMERVKQIVRSLLDFARVDTQQTWQYADIHHGIDSTLAIIARQIGKVAEVSKRYGQLPAIECLPCALNQVFMNLLINAAHAIGPERGQITISTGVDGALAWIEIGDTGCGIAEDVLPSIFDPFFTTKPVGKGAGLGLSLCYGIVQDHHGRIEVRSAPRQGTAFRVVLPLRRQAGAQAA